MPKLDEVAEQASELLIAQAIRQNRDQIAFANGVGVVRLRPDILKVEIRCR